MSKVRVGLIGSGFVSDLHATGFKIVPDAEVVAVASRTPGKAKRFAQHHGIAVAFENYWDVQRSGGGVLLDMGCHSIEYARWVFGKPRVKGVTAHLGTYIHADKTRGEDHSVCIVEYEGGQLGVAENSWAKAGGVDDRCEIYGSAGFTRADLLRGSSLLTYIAVGYGYAVEKAGKTRGYTFTMFEGIWNYGLSQEMQSFVRRVQAKDSSIGTGDGGCE